MGMKIWIKLQKGDKTPAHTVVEMPSNATYDEFILALREGCHALDVATPSALASHHARFMRFGTVRFYPDDFVESVNFDKMEIEQFRSKKPHVPSIYDV
jgi:hypothetical protein